MQDLSAVVVTVLSESPFTTCTYSVFSKSEVASFPSHITVRLLRGLGMRLSLRMELGTGMNRMHAQIKLISVITLNLVRLFTVLPLFLPHSYLVQEFADALMEVKEAIVDVRNSKTFRQVLGSLLAIGNFLNSKEVGTSESHGRLGQLQATGRERGYHHPITIATGRWGSRN